MATDLQVRLENLKVEIKSFTNQITRILTRPAPRVGTSDNSTALNNRTPAQMKTDADAPMTPHNNAVNNPHKLTPVLLNAPTPAEVNALLAPKALQGGLPVTQYGTLDAAALPVTSSGLTLTFTQAIPFLCWGSYYLLPAQSIVLNASKRLYAYAVVSNNVASYLFSETYLVESATQIYIGQVVTSISAISSVLLEKVTKLDNYRLSATGRGSSIPVTTGLPTAPAALDASWKS